MPTANPSDQQFPHVTVERTTCPGEHAGMVLVPYPIYRTMDPINLDAALVYRSIATASKRGPRRLDFGIDVLPRLDFPADIMHAVDALEQQGWLLRIRPAGSAERWTPLGRDRAKLAPRADLHVPELPANRRVPMTMLFGNISKEAG